MLDIDLDLVRKLIINFLDLWKNLTRERLKKLEDHPHVSFLHFVDFVDSELYQLLIQIQLYACLLAHRADFILNYPLYLVDRVGVKHDVGDLWRQYIKFRTIFFKRVDCVGYPNQHYFQVFVAENWKKILTQELPGAIEE